MEENKKLIKEIQNILKKKNNIKGYDPYFLGSEIPVPYILPELSKDILYLKNTSDWLPNYLPPIKDGMSLRYSNFTIVMNKKNRMAMYVALNIDRKQRLKRVRKSRKFRTDPRIGNNSQLNNAYYRNNPWDRGHLARLRMARWGENKILADIASKHTFYYTNICPQHDKFNKDEWRNLEEWVREGTKVKDSNKMVVFTGPIFEKKIFKLHPEGNDPIFIPSAFFKVVYYMDSQKNIKVYPFIMEQNEDTILNNYQDFNPKDYLVSLDEIEKRAKMRFYEP